MSLEKYVEIKISKANDLIEYLTNDLYCSSNNSISHRVDKRIGDIYTFANDKIIATMSFMEKIDVEMLKDDYDVDVNFSISFESCADINSNESILYFIEKIINDFESDLVYMPNFEKAIIIKRHGIIKLDDAFDHYCGIGMKNEFQKRLGSPYINL
ncbi:hypothetical protein SAMN02910406_00634 [Ruminococcus albus]|uniref:Uncharacterized protein n=2 Tax=Ruminococcus albus TaxID=1264 RepID=A0A1I1EH94_RUMAL|nr:hypothetical protein SAMN02910406_00634 [Ruminococcus albus]